MDELRNPSDVTTDGGSIGRSKFPSDWDSALNSKGKALFEEWTDASNGPLFTEESKARVSQGVLRSEVVSAMCNALYESFYSILEKGEKPVPADSLDRIEETGTDRLPKSYHLKGCFLNDEDSEAYERARDTGLLDLLESSRLLQVAESASGHGLEGPVGREILCYEHGDYTGPHTDHHPDDPDRKDGYVDVHVTLCNSYVDQQLLVSESDGHLNQQHRIGVESAISMSWLPHWHYTTPLVGKPGHEDDARRWLLLATYELE